jgi:hypothetical protein
MTEDEIDPENPRPEEQYPGFRNNEWQYVPDELAQTISLGPAGDGEEGQDWVLTYTPEKRDPDEDDVARLKLWLATDSRLGSRPPSIVIPEFTDAGVPHVQVLLFGGSWVVPHSGLSAYWSDSRDRGEVVWFDRLRSRSDGGRWRWADEGPEDATDRSPQIYLRKVLDSLDSRAREQPEKVSEAARALRKAGGAAGSTERMDGVRERENGERPIESGGSTDALDRGRE